jgi:hypothetical protein
VLRINPLTGKPEFIKAGVNLVAKETMMGLCITVNKKRAFFNSAEDLYANAICVLSKDRLMLTFIGIANIVSKT